ncbi:MAG: SDR family oxidoreductase [Proteobacteria bacterium]|nr:SDR family oxidoreductase [Pseudomonadota bacterium]
MAEKTLDDLQALVTGGSSGIGFACARRLILSGATVTIVARASDRLARAVERLKAEIPDEQRVRSMICDVTVEDDVRSAVRFAAGEDEKLHITVAAAGIGMLAPIITTDMDTWRMVIDTNLTGTFLTLKHAARAMVNAGGGSFVALSSISAAVTHPYMTTYCVSKAGIEALVAGAADELGRARIRVNAVRPGMTPTELTAGVVDDPEIRATYLSQMPLNERLIDVEDIASTVRFLVGPESAKITGEAINVSGGHQLRRGPDYENLTRQLWGDDAIEGRIPLD